MPKVVPVAEPGCGAVAGLSTAAGQLDEVDAADRRLMNAPTGMRVSSSSDHTAQFTPSSAFLFTLTSTMIASTSTCVRRMSSLSMIAMSERMILAGAVMTSALVSGSAQIVVERSALAATLEAAAPPRRRGAPLVMRPWR